MENFFQQHRQEITDAIGRVASNAGLNGELTLVEGLVFNDIQDNPRNIVIGGGKRIPLVAVVENSTGKVHYFALKVLLPNINF